MSYLICKFIYVEQLLRKNKRLHYIVLLLSKNILVLILSQLFCCIIIIMVANSRHRTFLIMICTKFDVRLFVLYFGLQCSALSSFSLHAFCQIELRMYVANFTSCVPHYNIEYDLCDGTSK